LQKSGTWLFFRSIFVAVVPPATLNKEFHQPGLLARLLKGQRPQPPAPNQWRISRSVAGCLEEFQFGNRK
jgi:hypothetical protein